jgi:hypothetical protein
MRPFILAIIISVLFLLLSVRATRQQQLREQLSLVWIGMSLAMVALSLSLPFHLLDHIAHAVGIAYPPDLVFLVAVLLLIALIFHLSKQVARLTKQNTALVQEFGILTATLHGDPQQPPAEGAGVQPARDVIPADPSGR